MRTTAPGHQVVATVLSDSPEETQALAGAVAALCRSGDVVLLAGDLGSGKTTFTQGMARALGVLEGVTSPTFTLVRPYRTAGGNPGGVSTLLHADLYRLDEEAEMADLGLDQLVEDHAVAVVEWGDKAAGLLGHDALVVDLERVPGGEGRRLTFSVAGPHWGARRRPLEAVLEAAGGAG